MKKVSPKQIQFQSKLSNKQFVRFYGKDITINVPAMGDSITEGKLQEWLKAENSVLAADDIIARIETDKVIVDIRAPEKGTLLKHLAPKDVDVKVGQPLFIYSTDVKEGASTTTKTEAPKQEVKKEAPKVEQKVEVPKQPVQQVQQPTTGKIEYTSSSREKRVGMSKIRQRISQRLKDSQNTYALLTTFNEVDMTNLMQLREQHKDRIEKKHGVKFGFMSAFMKASTFALMDQPVVNAVIDGNDIVYRDYVDISVAVATPNGLVVPVVRNCQDMNMIQIEKSLAELALKAKNNQIQISDMQGGTFTVSNGGVFGSMMGTPIVNPPQSAILGMHAIKKRAVVVGDKIEIRPMMYLALTYDHRLIDGREAVTFLVKVKDLIENPSSMLLE